MPNLLNNYVNTGDVPEITSDTHSSAITAHGFVLVRYKM